MKLKLITLLSLGMLASNVGIAQAVVIDSQQVGEAPAASKATASGQAPATAQAANEEGRARAEAGRKKSPRERAQLVKAATGDSNLQEGRTFLAANKAKKGVITLADGVQYKIVKAGKGKKPSEDSTIMCRYKGTLINGTGFDQTDEKKPSPIKVSGLLPGLKEAVKMMSSGSKWEIVIPSELAYGAQGNRGVGENAVVIYKFEVVGIK